jgi:hypothetical protein
MDSPFLWVSRKASTRTAWHAKLRGDADSIFHVDIGIRSPVGHSIELVVRVFGCDCAPGTVAAHRAALGRIEEFAKSRQLGVEFMHREESHLAAATRLSKTARAQRLIGGIETGNVRSGASGTLGAVVRDRATKDLLALSCGHVYGDFLPLGCEEDRGLVSQPSSVLDANIFGKWLEDKQAWSAGKRRRLDCAVASIDRKKRDADSGILELGPIKGVASLPLPGMAVKKFGAATGVTRGVVLGVGPDDVAIGRPPDAKDQAIAGIGDSGAIWLQEGTNEAVGLLYQMLDIGEPNEEAFAVRMDRVVQELDIELS